MKTRLSLVAAALLGSVAPAVADVQINAGALYASGENEGSFGLELGAGFYFEHTTSSLASSLTLNYLGISTIEDNFEGVDIDAGFDVFALDYRLAFPLVPENVLNLYIEGLIGAANADAEAKIRDLRISSESWGFAWGLGAGLSWNITDNFGLDGGYTYLGLDAPNEEGFTLGDDQLHLIRVGAHFRF